LVAAYECVLVRIFLVNSHRTPVRMTVVEQYNRQQNMTGREYTTIIKSKN
jgi:hypothetical protein